MKIYYFFFFIVSQISSDNTLEKSNDVILNIIFQKEESKRLLGLTIIYCYLVMKRNLTLKG